MCCDARETDCRHVLVAALVISLISSCSAVLIHEQNSASEAIPESR